MSVTCSEGYSLQQLTMKQICNLSSGPTWDCDDLVACMMNYMGDAGEDKLFGYCVKA